jgi:multidrug efflux pump subunit AcrB
MFHLMLAAFAVFAFLRLPVELTPQVDFPRLSVVTNWGQASSEMVVRNITLPVEEAASSISGARNVSSTSSEGNSVVKVDLDKSADVNFARLELMEKLSAIKKDLPQNASFPQIKKYVPNDFSSLQGFLSYNLHAKISRYAGDMSLSKIQKYAEDNIKPALLGVKGVGSVRVLGGAERQIYVLLNRKKIQSLGLTLAGISNSISINTNQKNVGSISERKKKYFIFTGNKIRSPGELKNIDIFTGNNLTVKLGSIAQIKDSLANPRSYARINGKPSVTLEIDREQGTNMLDLASSVQNKIGQIKASLPGSLAITKIFDKSRYMRKEISELSSKVILSIIVIFLVVLLFFRKIFHSFIIVSSVVFSLAGGIIFLSLSDIGLNVLSLAALALSLGIVIDNNVVVVENILRYFELESSAGRESFAGGILNTDFVKMIGDSLQEIKLPLIAATLTTIGALIPIFFLPADLKPYFLQFAETAAVVIAFSLLIALMFVPVSLLIFFKLRKNNSSQAISKFSYHIKNIYISIVTWIVLHKKTALILAIWLFGLPVWLLPSSIETSSGLAGSSPVVRELADFYNSIFESDTYQEIKPYVDYGLGGASQLFFQHIYKGELWNYGNETYLMFSIWAPQGTPPAQINKFTRQVEALLLPDIKKIKNITTKVYSGYANIRVSFSDSVALTAVPYVIKNRLTGIAARTGGFNVSVAGFGHGYYSGGGISPSYEIEVLGYNYKMVKNISRMLSKKLKVNPRVDNIKIDRLPGQAESDQILAEVNRRNLSRYGADVFGFMRQFSPYVSTSLSSFSVLVNNDPVRTIIKYADYNTASFTGLPSKEITLNSKRSRIGEFVNMKVDPIMPVIQRDNQQYSRYISFEFKGPFRFGDEFTNSVIKSFSVPPGYEIKRPNYFFVFGKKETLPLTLLGLLSVLIVFMVTASLYESYKKPFIIILSVPMSLIGLFAVFYFFNANFGRGGYASILFLVGLAVNNGILLVDRIAQVEKDDEASDRKSRAKTIAGYASQRLRPILMTALITAAGFLPFVINADVYSFWYTFSLGIIGGITVSTFMILFIMPALYEIIGKRRRYVNMY